MKSFFQTIYNFIFSPYETENINNKKPIQDSGILEKFIGDNDENTSNIKYSKIFQPFYSDNSIIIKSKDIEEDSFFNNFKITFNSENDLSKLNDSNLKPFNRKLINEFTAVENDKNIPKTCINLEYKIPKENRAGKIIKNYPKKYQ